MRPRIGLDARFALGERRGIGNYSLELFRAMASMNHEFEFVFYSDREDTEGLLSYLPNSQVRVIRPGFYPLWEQVLLPLALRRDDIDLFHAVGNTAPVIMPRRTKLVITLCDVMYMKDESLLPLSRSWYQRAGRFYRRLIVPPAARNADHLLTISEFSRTDICETLSRIRPEKVSVTLLGLPSSFQVVPPQEHETSPLGATPYLLHLGGLDPRKNTRMVVRCFLDLKKSDQLEEKLVILGLKTLDSLDLDPHEVSEARTWIHLPGFVSEMELPRFYRHARAFLFPSLYEGFGIPLLEAMACGTPIITSNVSSLPEVAGSAAILIDQSRPDRLKGAILDLLGSLPLQTHLRQEGRLRAEQFNWNNTAELTLRSYRDIFEAFSGRMKADATFNDRV
jgi:glycosyltransferase involved in cell wall biosynthesis